jgi:glycosyltransferase involved in cell wall biosynthesis
VAGEYRGSSNGAEFVGRVSDDELIRLYRGASAFVDTSLYEGFGYQVLEAMASGAPVVASETTSIPEVVGDAGLLCRPGDAEAFAAALRRVLGDETLAADLRERGLARAREFTWERTAQQLADAIDEALA